MDERLVRMLGDLQGILKSRGSTVATAESCTGGLLATWLTHLAGSSAVYRGGVGAYSNDAKERLLGVHAMLLQQHGAVSGPVAEAMAAGARDRLSATYAVSITGVAGPEGGSPAKPVGTVFVGIATQKGVRSLALSLKGDRAQIRDAAARQAIDALVGEVKESK